HYLGIYNGKASEPHVCEAIETSDCLLSIGYRPIEVTTGDFSASLPGNTIYARGHSVDVGDDNYQAVTLKEMLKGVIEAVPQIRNRARRPVAGGVVAGHADGSAKLTQAAYWPAIQAYLRPRGRAVRRQWHVIRSLRSEVPPEMHLRRVSQLGVDRLFARSPARHADRSIPPA